MKHRCFYEDGPLSRPTHDGTTHEAIARRLNEAEKEAPIGNVQIVSYGAGLYVYCAQQEAKDVPAVRGAAQEKTDYERAREDAILRSMPIGQSAMGDQASEAVGRILQKVG